MVSASFYGSRCRGGGTNVSPVGESVVDGLVVLALGVSVTLVVEEVLGTTAPLELPVAVGPLVGVDVLLAVAGVLPLPLSVLPTVETAGEALVPESGPPVVLAVGALVSFTVSAEVG